MEVTFRQAREEDYEFLWHLHKATMKSYVDETWGWNEEFQVDYFSNKFETKNIQLIIFNDKIIGAIEFRKIGMEFFVANFEIVPQFQNKGIGSTILNRIIVNSDRKKKPIKLQVLKVNPAKRFYKQFGFKTVDKTETHYIMERNGE